MNEPTTRKIRTPHLTAMKKDGRRIVMMTAYDAITARWADQAEIDVILVGDSLGNTALGLRDTIPVTVDMMVHHCAAVARGAQRALLVGDLPFMAYKISTAQALATAARFIQEGAMEAVKLEGGAEMAPAIRALTEAGIPVVAHLGLTPQSVHTLGGYRTVGAEETAALKLRDDARALEAAGAIAIVLEMIPAPLARTISAACTIPTIGIGAGAGCDGQVLVLADVLGMTPDPPFRFVRQYAHFYQDAVEGLRQYSADVREGRFPGQETDA